MRVSLCSFLVISQLIISSTPPLLLLVFVNGDSVLLRVCFARIFGYTILKATRIPFSNFLLRFPCMNNYSILTLILTWSYFNSAVNLTDFGKTDVSQPFLAESLLSYFNKSSVHIF